VIWPHLPLRSFLVLFTRKALSMYVRQQDVIIRQHVVRLGGWGGVTMGVGLWGCCL